MLFAWAQDESEGEMKGTTNFEKVIHAIEMIRCGYKTTRKVKFEKDTWKWFTESVTVNNFKGLYDNQTYDYINVQLFDDTETVEVPANLTYQSDGNLILEMFRGEVVKFDLGKLVIKVDKNHAQALYNYLKPSDVDFEKQKRQFIDEIVNRFKNKEYTRAKVINILSISSQCLFEYLTVEQRIELLKLISTENGVPESVERIVVDIIRTLPPDNKSAKDFLFKMQEEKLFDFYDKSIHDFGGKENYTRYLTLLANTYYLAFPNELENQFDIDQFGNVYVKTISKPTTIGYYQLGFSTYATPYLKWDENCNVLGIKYQDGKIDFSVLENCGYLKDAPKEVSPLTPVVIEFPISSNYILDKNMNDRTFAMPAFMAMRYVNDSRATALLTLISDQINIVAAVMSAGQALSVKLFLGKGLSAWFAKTYLAFKATQNSLDFLFSYKGFRDVVDKIGDNNEGKDFRLAFGKVQDAMELGGFSFFDAILLKQKYAEIVNNLHDLERYWQIVKLHPDVNKILDEDQKKVITESIKKALETYEKSDIVE